MVLGDRRVLLTSTSHYFEIDVYRVVFALLILVYACYSDIRRRSVSNIVWLVMAGVTIAFAGYYTVIQRASFIIAFVLSVTITSTVSYIFFRLRLFGGADAKALICIAVLFPTQPSFTILFHQLPLFDAYLTIIFPFAFTVLLNAAVLALIVPVSLSLRNLRSLGLKEFIRNATLCFVAYRVNIDELRSGRFIRLTHT